MERMRSRAGFVRPGEACATTPIRLPQAEPSWAFRSNQPSEEKNRSPHITPRLPQTIQVYLRDRLKRLVCLKKTPRAKLGNYFARAPAAVLFPGLWSVYDFFDLRVGGPMPPLGAYPRQTFGNSNGLRAAIFQLAREGAGRNARGGRAPRDHGERRIFLRLPHPSRRACRGIFKKTSRVICAAARVVGRNSFRVPLRTIAIGRLRSSGSNLW
jgi:hypothetical protein